MDQETTPAEGNSVPNPSTQAEVKSVPYGRFQEENHAKKEMIGKWEKSETEVARLNKVIEDANTETLKKNSEFETLYNDSQTLAGKQKEQLEAQSKELTAINEVVMADVDEAEHEFMKSMDTATRMKYINKLNINANAGKTDSSRAGTQAKGDFGGYSSYAEWATKDPKGYEEVNGIVGNQGNAFNVGG